MTKKIQNNLNLLDQFKKGVDKNFFFLNKKHFFLNNAMKRYYYTSIKILKKQRGGNLCQ